MGELADGRAGWWESWLAEELGGVRARARAGRRTDKWKES